MLGAVVLQQVACDSGGKDGCASLAQCGLVGAQCHLQ